MSVQSDFQEKVSACFRPWQRSFQFWVRAVDIYTGYKVPFFIFFFSSFDFVSGTDSFLM